MLRLHGYWRSTACYRVRLALHLKGVAFDQVTYDLRQDEHSGASYKSLAPHGLVPALETQEGLIIESPAILEWLEERFPAAPLLPADPKGRAQVRAMMAIVACDIHPLNNLRVLKALRRDLKADEPAIEAWIAHWIGSGFTALEALVAQNTQGFSYGTQPSLADCCLLPQVYSAERFKVDLEAFPTIRAIAARLRSLPAVMAAHPDRQPDADRT